jgi:hypothetical protein
MKNEAKFYKLSIAPRLPLTADRKKNKKFEHVGHVIHIEIKIKKLQVLQELHVKKWCAWLGSAVSGWRLAESGYAYLFC